MDKRIDSRMPVAGGVEIPVFGLGVFQARSGGETRRAVECALEVGYRHIDTAAIYRNEADVGQAVRASSVPREDIFVTTKVWNDDHGYEQTLAACKRSLDALGLDYVDLYLIHWPVQRLRHDTWRALIQLQADGLTRAIGVSNYTVRHLQELLDRTPEHVPAVDQVEFSPFLHQHELLDFCRKHDIALEAYSPLVRGQRFGHPTLREIAERHARTEAQILIRWALEHDLVVIPKSTNPERIRENASVFDFALSERDMESLDGLNEDFRVAWDPTRVP